MKIMPVSPENERVQKLIAQLDKYQIGLYGIDCCHLDSAAELKRSGAYLVGVYVDDELTGIGAVKLFEEYAEIKRVYVEEAFRGSGIAEKIISTLEGYARQNGKTSIYLETGILQYAALQFYKKLGYKERTQFGSYMANGLSVFFEKKI